MFSSLASFVVMCVDDVFICQFIVLVCDRCVTCSESSISQYGLPLFSLVVHSTPLPSFVLAKLVSALCISVNVSARESWSVMRIVLSGSACHAAMKALFAVCMCVYYWRDRCCFLFLFLCFFNSSSHPAFVVSQPCYLFLFSVLTVFR